jgi:hypothetical protein
VAGFATVIEICSTPSQTVRAISKRAPSTTRTSLRLTRPARSRQAVQVESAVYRQEGIRAKANCDVTNDVRSSLTSTTAGISVWPADPIDLVSQCSIGCADHVKTGWTPPLRGARLGYLMTGGDGVRLAAWVFAALCIFVGLFHLAAICGAPVGHLTMGGRWSGVLPPAARLLSALSMVIVLVLAFIVLARAGVVDRSVPRWGMRAVLGYLAVAVLMHVMTPSPGERKLWLPVIFTLTVSALWVEFKAPHDFGRRADK